ncbi:MAG: 4-(cytidine 5'-diphospho)-2-C-methyl-D-erythritol kinase [Planctomycetia bacterium]|nr:4-(cytidine 5'-diphospho)-2-C-methyl-D-erythritol kinase [Planctomycetia bacterium]
MHVHRNAPVVTVFAPAKLNLFLEVLGQRADGFHEIETLMVPVALWDTLHFESTADDHLHCDCFWPVSGTRGATAAAAPSLGENNLALRAIRLLRERAGAAAGARLRLVKRIPIAAGLAGGSSDAAAALVAANIGWKLDWPRDQLGRVAAELGSDVAFFLQRHPAVCRGRGELVDPRPGLAPLHFVVVQPPVGLSTAEVYKRCQPADAPGQVSGLVAAWRQGRTAEVGRLLVNRLEAAAATLSPWIERLRGAFARFDFLGHQMTGSGSAYFGLCRHARQARILAAALRQLGFPRAFALAGLN